MIVAATISWNDENGLNLIDKVFTNAEYTSLDDIFNHLRHTYLEKYVYANAELLIDLGNVEYALSINSQILKREAVKLRDISVAEHVYLTYLFETYAHLGGLGLDRWMTKKCFEYATEDAVISDYPNFRDFNEAH